MYSLPMKIYGKSKKLDYPPDFILVDDTIYYYVVVNKTY